MPPPNDPNICEGISGLYFYHIRNGKSLRSLCGATVMHSGLPLSAWGTVTHMRERYCSKCAAIREKQEQGHAAE